MASIRHRSAASASDRRLIDNMSMVVAIWVITNWIRPYSFLYYLNLGTNNCGASNFAFTSIFLSNTKPLFKTMMTCSIQNNLKYISVTIGAGNEDFKTDQLELSSAFWCRNRHWRVNFFCTKSLTRLRSGIVCGGCNCEIVFQKVLTVELGELTEIAYTFVNKCNVMLVKAFVIIS